MDWEINFNCGNADSSSVFIHKLFYFLVSRGMRYNAHKYKGHYQIIGKETENDIYFMEKEIKDSTEKLAEIIDTYLKFDLTTTSLNIWLDYSDEVSFTFDVTILPMEDSKVSLSFGTGEHLIQDEKTFLAFINLCKELFVRFNYSYGAFRSEYEYDFPFNKEDVLKEKPNIVNFYSKPLVDEIGREKLLSAPAFKVEELENGGIMLIMCTNVLGCENNDAVLEHLGYSTNFFVKRFK